MKKMKKLLSVILTAIMVLTMAAPAMAADTYSITINNPVEDHTYAAYQVFKGDLADSVLSNVEWGDGVNGAAVLTDLQADDSFGAGAANIFATATSAADVAKAISAQNLAKDADMIQAFAKIVGANLTGTASGTSTYDGTEKKYVIDGLTAGYYLVKNTAVPEDDAFTRFILEVVKDVEVTPKSGAPDIDKKIVEEDASEVEVNEASIGDTITYKLTSHVPDMTGYNYYYFIMNDTMSKGLTYTGNANMTVTIDGTPVAYTATHVTDSITGVTSLKIVFENFIQHKDKVGKDIVVTYTATLNTEAEIGINPNTNKVDLTYSNDPNYKYDGTKDEPGTTDPVGKAPEVTVETYVTELTIIKTDENGEILTGVEFTLTGTSVNIVLVSEETFALDNTDGTYWKLKNGTYTETDPSTTGIDKTKYESETDKYKKTTTFTAKGNGQTEVNVVGEVNPDGTIIFRGLGAGTYTLSETKTPAGYNTIEDIDFTISFNSGTKKFASSNPSIVVGDTTNTLSTTIINNSGNTLPSTGGIGTTIFYIVGIGLMLGSAIMLITKKRITNRK